MASVQNTNGEGAERVFDEDLNSRNLFTYGMDAMTKLARSSVAVIGLNGVGAEAAKCLILANVGTVTLVDEALVAFKDLSTHFYLSEQDIGRNRADACHRQLQELNPNVVVRTHIQAVTQALLAQHNAIVVCDGSLPSVLHLNTLCRTLKPPISLLRYICNSGLQMEDALKSLSESKVRVNGEVKECGSCLVYHEDTVMIDGQTIAALHASAVAFVLAEARGVCFRLFSDFGPEPYESLPGDTPYCIPVAKIERSASGGVTVTVSMASSSSFGELPRRDHVVTFSGVQGTTDDKGSPLHFRVATRPEQRAEVGDAVLWRFDVEPIHGSHCSIEVCAGKGHLRRHILPERFSFSSLAHSLQAPGSLANREWKVYGRSEQLHVAFAALHQFAERNSGAHPNPRVSSDLDAYLDLCRSLYSSFPDFSGGMDEGVMRLFARSFAGLLNPISAILGALAAQEAIKRLSEKYFPVCDPQWFYFEALDTLPEDSKWQDQRDFEPQHCRYDDQIVLLGRGMQALIGSSKVFMIGAGALGCELLKNFALMGVACGENGDGLLTITDNDHIEKSNLSRQFLFRSHHIKRSKSECASEAVRSMNPKFNVVSHGFILDNSTQHVFHDQFWSSIDVAVNALDTVKARKFVSDKCMRFCKPNLECATGGLDCQSHSFLPFLTDGYQASSDVSNSSLPCTKKFFPYLAVHCLQYAQGEFELEFSIVPHKENLSCVLQGRDSPRKQENHLLILERITLSLLHVTTFEQCVAWARALYDEYLWRVEDTVLEHPEDEIEGGVPFWSAPKRFPCAREHAFNWDDEDCKCFVKSAAILKARTCGVALPQEGEIDIDTNWLHPQNQPLFSQLSERKKIVSRRANRLKAQEDLAVDADAAAEADEIRRLVSIATAAPPDNLRIQPIYFNKDDPAHMNFALACASIRMKFFRIEPVDRIEAIRILGNSLAAVATATAIAAGLTSLHFLKLLQQRDLLVRAHSLAFEQQESLRSLFCSADFSLSTSSCCVCDANAATKHEFGRASWTAWDVWKLKPNPCIVDLWNTLGSRGIDLRMLAEVQFEKLSLLEPDFKAFDGALRRAPLLQTCRQKIKDMTEGSADKKQSHWRKLMEGKVELEIHASIYDARIVRLSAASGTQRADAGSKALTGPGDSSRDIQLHAEASAGVMTTADIKRQLTEKHNIDWTKKSENEDMYISHTLCRLEDDRVGEELLDDSERVDCGSSLMLYRCNQKGKISLKLPTLLFDLPAETAESTEIDGLRMIPVKVKPLNSENELVEDEELRSLQLPRGCTARQLKQMLVDVGYYWAVCGSKVIGFSSREVTDESVIPSNCNCLKVIQKKLPR